MNNVSKLTTALNHGCKINYKYKGEYREEATIVKIDEPSVFVRFRENNIYHLKIALIEDIELFFPIKSKELKKKGGVREYYSYIIDCIDENNENNKDDLDYFNFNGQRVKTLLNKDKASNSKNLKYFLDGDNYDQYYSKQDYYGLLFMSNLNQNQAIKNAISERISIIKGPPGTGKTQTILNIISNAVLFNKTVLIVSKHNSAVDNVKEELDDMEGLLPFYVRLGNATVYTPKLIEDLPSIIEKAKESIPLSDSEDISIKKLQEMFRTIEDLEKKKRVLQIKENTLNDLNNQKRHVLRKLDVYDAKKESIEIRKRFIGPSTLEREYKFLKSIQIEKKRIPKFILNLYSRFRFKRKSIPKATFVLYQWTLEELYVNTVISKLEEEIASLESIKKTLANVYKDYIKLTRDLMNQAITKRSTKFESLEKKISDPQIESREIVKECLKIFPVILTTLDSVSANIGTKLFDYVIVDESSQADIISAIPAINVSKQLIIVGDEKQLSPIVENNIKKQDDTYLSNHPEIDPAYKYSENSLLDVMDKLTKPKTVLLNEHYRCDYNIINFCNRKYYNNSLIICTGKPKLNSLKFLDVNKQRASFQPEESKVNGSYKNNLEIAEIIEHLGNDLEKVSIISPYKAQTEALKESLSTIEDQIGTIHTFQGRQNNKVLMSSVRTLADSNANIDTLIDSNLINVAVSRAKHEFILFSNKPYFKKHNHELLELINYIEVYGETLESKVNSIFDYLYTKIKDKSYYEGFDSPWEKNFFDALEDILKDYPNHKVIKHLALSDFVVDKTYLEENPLLESFAIHQKSHIDLTITNENNQPILAIEIDGKQHNDPIQIERDTKKNKILKDHDIPLWRVKSTDVVTYEDVKGRVAGYINGNMFKH